MNEKGYILLSRAILDSDVFASQKLLKIWIWCLCKANFKDRSIPLKIGRGETVVKVKRGQFIFGRFKAEEELFIDGSTIYKSIKKLEEHQMIKIESSNQYSVITICKYDTYQDNNTYKITTKEQPSNNQVTAEGQPSNTTNTLPNVKKVNKGSKNKITPENFIKWFNKCRVEIAKYKHSNINTMSVTTKNNLNELSKHYTKEDFQRAFNGMLEDGWPKSNNKITPDHFLNIDNFNKYLSIEPKTKGEKLLG